MRHTGVHDMPSSVHPDFPHFFEIMKIVDGALHADRNKVIAYVQQLAQKLDADGNNVGADRLRKSLAESKLPTISAASAAVGAKIPIDNDSRLTLADERRFQPGEIRAVLKGNSAEKLAGFLSCVRSADKLAAEGIEFNPSLLLYGPPGCGKTQLAKYVAAELRLPLLTARIDSLISSFLGSTSKNLRLLFEHAKSRPCVLFLDELDALGKLRDDQHELGELKRVVVSLLQNMDILHGETIILGATNHEHLLDPALWRRFSFRMHIPLPDSETRRELFDEFLQGHVIDKDLQLFDSISEGLSGSDIKEMCSNARREAVINDNPSLIKKKLVLNLLIHKAPQLVSKDLPLAKQLELARGIAPETISYRLLAEVFDISVGYVHKLLKQEGGRDE